METGLVALPLPTRFFLFFKPLGLGRFFHLGRMSQLVGTSHRNSVAIQPQIVATPAIPSQTNTLPRSSLHPVNEFRAPTGCR